MFLITGWLLDDQLAAYLNDRARDTTVASLRSMSGLAQPISSPSAENPMGP